MGFQELWSDPSGGVNASENHYQQRKIRHRKADKSVPEAEIETCRFIVAQSIGIVCVMSAGYSRNYMATKAFIA